MMFLYQRMSSQRLREITSESGNTVLLQDLDFQEKHAATNSMRRRELELSAPHIPCLRSNPLPVSTSMLACSWGLGSASTLGARHIVDLAKQ